MKLPKNTIFTFLIISLLIIIAFLYYAGIDRKPTVNTQPLYDSIFKLDSTNRLLLIDNANLSLKISQKDSTIVCKNNQLAFIKKKYKDLLDSLPKLTSDSQVNLFVSNFDFGQDYIGNCIVPVQCTYQANLTAYNEKQCQETSAIKDTIINQYIDKDLISQKIIENCYKVISNDSATVKDLMAIIYEADQNYQVSLKQVKGQRNISIGLNVLQVVILGLVIGK